MPAENLESVAACLLSPSVVVVEVALSSCNVVLAVVVCSEFGEDGE